MDFLNKSAKQLNHFTETCEIKMKIQNFRIFAKFKCREICEPQNREIDVSRKFHAIRYFKNNNSFYKKIVLQLFY